MPVIINGTTGISGVDGSAGTPAFQGSDTNTGIRFGADIVSLVTGGSDRLYIDSSGRLGVGTATPTSRIHVFQTGSTQAGLIETDQSASVFNFKSTGQASGQPQMGCAGSDLILNTNGAERLRIDSSGRVGIGTTSPGAKVEVGSYTPTAPSLSSNSGASFSVTGTDNIQLNIGSNPSSPYNGWIQMRDTLPNVARPLSLNPLGGQVVVGSTSVFNGTIGGRFQAVVDSSANYPPIGAVSNYSGDVSNPAQIFYKYDNNSTTSQVFARFVINNTSNGSGQINANGASQAAFGSYSDARLKENIIDLPSQWQNFKELRPVEFDYIQSQGGGHQIGFIAQEVREVFEDLVGEGENEMLTLSGMGKQEARLIKALQEAMERIEQLEAKIAALEAV